MRGCKLCPKKEMGIVVGGEYGLTHALFRAGYNIATLMSRYAEVRGRGLRGWGLVAGGRGLALGFRVGRLGFRGRGVMNGVV
jgi:hypothetical protein